MKTRILIFLIILLSILALSLPAAEAGSERWKAIAGKNDQGRILYDPDSVIPSGPMVYRVRILDFDKNHVTRKSLEEFDCTNKIYREMEVITEAPNKPALRTIAPSEWRDITKESTRGELLRILCR